MRYFLLFSFCLSWALSPFFSVLARDVTDRFRSELWYLDQMSAPDAWEVETGSEETIVAVLDAGFDLDHEDLVSQYWHNEDELAGDDKDNDGNGYDDDVIGWDFVDGDPDPSSEIDDAVSDTVASHGTVIAGIIGATANNGIGITGINWDVSLMPLRVLNEAGAGTTTDVRRAIVYAVENGADVINLSFTFTQTDGRLRETIEWAYDQGVILVAAVGNGAVDTDATPIYPACFDLEVGKNVVIGVAATDQDDFKADFSNFGTACTDLAAPGVDIFASVYHDSSSLAFITAYASPWEGTSLASPMVSGAAALLRSRYPSLTPDQVRNTLKLSVDSVAETSLEARKQLGAGRLNLSRALEYAATIAGQGRTTSGSTVTPSGSFVVAQGRGSQPTVRRVTGSGEVLSEFLAYHPEFLGGVRLAVGDVDGDGQEEIVTGAGPSGGPQVRIFDMDGNVEGQFFAFDEGNRLGIFVASGDVNGDGVDEIFVTSDEGGTGQIRIFNRYGHLKGAFFPHGRTTSPLQVAVANVDTDAEEEVITALGSSGDGTVMVHDGTGRYVDSFTALQGKATGLSLAHADTDRDGMEELIVAAAEGHVPAVGVYNQGGELLTSFFAFPLEFRPGVHVTSGDIDRNGTVEIYVTAMGGGGPHMRIFNAQAQLIGGFFAFDSFNRYGAVAAIY